MNEIANDLGEPIRYSMCPGTNRYADYLFRVALGNANDTKFLHEYYCHDLNEDNKREAKRMAAKRLRSFAKEKNNP